jgi:hypothetical protein
MIERNDNYIPACDEPRRTACDSLRRYGSTGFTTGGSPLSAFRSAGECDEDVLASIARRHVSSLGIRQTYLIPPDAPPAAGEAEPSPNSADLRETSPKGVFYVRRALCESPGKPARSEPIGVNPVCGRIARVLIVYLISMAVLTVLTVAVCFVTRLDGQVSKEFAQAGILADGGMDSSKTEDPETETRGRQNVVVVADG